MSLLARRRFCCCAAVAVLAALTACSPAHDWREVRPAGTRAVLLFPCRPATQQRAVPLAGPAVQLSLLACTAGGQTWALAHADLANPARVGPALAELRTSAMAKLNAGSAPLLPMAVPGATPNEHSGRIALAAQAQAAAAKSGALQMQLMLFAHGTQVFQASVLGESIPDTAADNFFTSIGFKP